MTEHLKEVDIIFVGGGTAACVAAGRLAAANPDLEILLVEQGPNNLNDPAILTPGLFLNQVAPTSKTASFWEGNKSDALNGRSPVVATGQVLGGGSSINFIMYTRASASDYDDWKTPGWTAADLVPLLRKSETYHIDAGRETHGYDGPMNVSYADPSPEVSGEYLDVAVQLGIPLVEDKMDLKTGHGCQRWPIWVDPKTGHRQDAAHRYIHPLSKNKSLHILTGTKATRILFEGTKATGVEVIGNKHLDADADQTPRAISARKLVVVSSGAMGTPIILQRSGIGAADRLSKAGVEVVVNLPGVGANYEDHTILMIPFFVPDDTETIDPLLNQEPGFLEKLMPQFLQGKGMLASNVTDAGSKLRPTEEELKEMGPEFNEIWKKYFESKPDKPVISQVVTNGFLGPRDIMPSGSRMFALTNFGLYPISRGHIYITSPDPYAAPDFNPALLDKQADVEVHVWAYKKAREIARRMPHYRGEFALLHPKFPQGSAASSIRLESSPDISNVKHIKYTAEDDAAIEVHIRQFGQTGWHSCGTVPMKPMEANGCVDARLNIYGTQNLKVADLSILPGNVGANTTSTALMIGEKAAIIIAQDLGLDML